MVNIPYARPAIPSESFEYVSDVLTTGCFEDGKYYRRCVEILRKLTSVDDIYLTPSCTDALEMAALLLDIGQGDEVIMPSYTFVSTANAFVLRGAVPVFVDIRNDTLNIHEDLIEQAITTRTKAIVAMHYAGVACDMNALMAIAKKHKLYVIEDAAQGIDAYIEDKHLGSMGHLSTFSFHHTKNITSGLGGCLLVNDSSLIERANHIYTKGTNRTAFIDGSVDKYTWVDVGSSYMMCELNAALLYSQLEKISQITKARLDVWNHYHHGFHLLESQGLLRRPKVPIECSHNAHIYYLILEHCEQRDSFMRFLKQHNITACFHYIPLHNSPAGLKYGRLCASMRETENLAGCIVRLPLLPNLLPRDIDYILDVADRYFRTFY